ncbi:MAG: TolC family protein, partial [Candidatus Omnitrophica bacterium]|nr:TolC family protein [Candidatus Omnitrophota bacterium]MBI3010719.1 TolC family protein [Candidatus Omnitrophota bacterium]
ELYENALLPEAEMAFYSDRAGYEAGSQDALNLLDSERVYLNAKLAYHQALASLGKSFAELERATGIELRTGQVTP